MRSEISVTDFQRILFGDVPAEFYVELAFRTVFVYFLITFGMRYMGKRVLSSLNRTELAGMSTIAAATGLVITAPDRGLLPAIIVMIVIIVMKFLSDRRSYSSIKFERYATGELSIMISEGIIDPKMLRRCRISTEQLFAQLRIARVMHLGEVKRFYMEANGSFSLIKQTDEGRYGLSTFPPWDTEFLKEQKLKTDVLVCGTCGITSSGTSEDKCLNCGQKDWKHPMES